MIYFFMLWEFVFYTACLFVRMLDSYNGGELNFCFRYRCQSILLLAETSEFGCMLINSGNLCLY